MNNIVNYYFYLLNKKFVYFKDIEIIVKNSEINYLDSYVFLWFDVSSFIASLLIRSCLFYNISDTRYDIAIVYYDSVRV